MIDINSESANYRKTKEEFIKKLAKLVHDYRTEIHVGELIGAMETVKMRLFMEANVQVEKEMKEKHKEGWEAL